MTQATHQTAGDVLSLLREKRVIVCAGAGGVGKTSVSAAMSLAAARLGKRVLVVTIDPSKRLAETLGVDRNPPEPVQLSRDRLEALGVTGDGTLAAWMLDPQMVSDRVVHRFSKTPEDAARLLENPIYKNVTAMIAGMQEYTAIEALHGFVKDDTYDLVILDTPPSRNALSFLEAPGRTAKFLDGRIFGLFVPGEGSFIRRAATRILETVMNLAFGSETRADLQVFFTLFGGILARLNSNAAEMRVFFGRPEVAFLIVTSPSSEAMEEASYFESRSREVLGLDLVGYILNRSLAFEDGRVAPGELDLGAIADEMTRSALKKLETFAVKEAAETGRHREILQELRERVGEGGLAVGLPYLSRGVDDLGSLAVLADALTDPSGA